jgi:Fe-S-cluster containining protein
MSQPDLTDLDQSPAAQFLKGLIDMTERTVAQTLGHERSRAAAIELSARVLKIAESTLPLIEAMHPPAKPIACKTGCTFCCRLPIVMTDVPTVFRLGFQVASGLPHETMVTVATSMNNADRPCIFLVDDACSVYADRPIVCRSYNAFDAGACAEGRFLSAGEELTGIGLGDPWPYGVGAAIQDGMASGLASLGIDARQVPMVPALRMLASDIDAAERWLRGEPAFAGLLEFH